MKHLYINSRLHPLALAMRGGDARAWIFSGGEPWLLLTPPRLTTLTLRLGLADGRIARLVDLVKRHSPEPEKFCRPLGLTAEPAVPENEYPSIPCPVCDNLHAPHPLDARLPCRECVTRRLQADRRRPGPNQKRERERDRAVRDELRRTDPQLFTEGALSPNWKLNQARRLHRDWDSAVNRILMGCTYRSVAQEFNCSTGLLHRKVQERKYWENN